MMNIAKINKKRGFSLIEVIVAMFISTVIILSVTAAFASAFRAQKKAREVQKSIEEAKATLEYMAKIIRMSSNIKELDGGASVHMYNKSTNQCVKYSFDSNGKKISSQTCAVDEDDVKDLDKGPCYYKVGFDEKPCSSDSSYGTSVYITNSDINDAQFFVSVADIKRVTIRMEMEEDENAKLQTTVSSRDYQDLNPIED